MRMWNVPTRLMCRKHLLGEHVETHMMAGHLRKGKPIGKYGEGLYDTDKLRERHDELAREMGRRDYNHKSPLPDFQPAGGWVYPVEENLRELARRCPDCKRIQENQQV